MAKTYNTFTNVATGDVYTASQHNAILTNLGNYRVPPMALTTITANQTVASGSNTKLALDAATFQTDDTMVTSGAAGRITVNTAGVYLVAFSFVYNDKNTTGARYATVTLNGETGADNLAGKLPLSNMLPQGNNWRSFSGSRLMSLSAGNYLQVEFYQSSGVSMTDVAAYPSFFQVAWLGQAS